jgi:hypothetical protein
MLDISAIDLTFFHSNMRIVELFYRIIIFLWNRDRIETRAKFLTTKEWSLVVPRIILLTDGNVMIATTIITRKISMRNLGPSAHWRYGGRSWWWYGGPHRLRQ